MEAICLSVVIQLVQRNSHLSGKLNEGNGESHQRDNKENGNAKLMSNLQEGACKFAPAEHSVRFPEKAPVESTGPELVNQLG